MAFSGIIFPGIFGVSQRVSAKEENPGNLVKSSSISKLNSSVDISVNSNDLQEYEQPEVK